jgi:hypothetical protein
MPTWLAKECAVFRLLPGGMGHPKDRTEEHVQAIVDHWLEHGELSTVGKRTVAQSRNNYTQQRDRDERDRPWMAVITLSSEIVITGKRLDKAVGQEVLSFQRRDARHWKYRIGCTSRSEPGALASEIETKRVETGALTERPITTEGRQCPNLDERRR